MNRIRLIAVALAALYFLMTFNAYACLVPLYGTAPMETGSNCAMPNEPPVRDACDAFKSLGVQSLSSVQPLPDGQVSPVAGSPGAISMLAPRQFRHDAFSGRPPLGSCDPFSLTSILRI